MKALIQSTMKTMVLVAALFSMSAFAQKVAVIDVEGVLRTVPQFQAMTTALQAEFAEEFAVLEKLRQDGEFNVEKLRRDGPTMSDAQKKELQDKIVAIQQEIQQKGGPLQQTVQRRQNEEQNKILGVIKQAMDAVAAEENIDIVLNANAVAFIKPELNISEKVIERVSNAK